MTLVFRISKLVSYSSLFLLFAAQSPTDIHHNSQEKENQDSNGKSLIALKPRQELKLELFKYEPVDVKVWGRYQLALKEENFPEVIALGNEMIGIFTESSAEYAEGELYIAIGLYKMGFTYGATTIFMKLAKNRIGTKIGQYALWHLDQISQTTYYDKLEIGEHFLTAYEFGEQTEDIQSFVSYHRALYNLSHGFKQWLKKSREQIHSLSYWHYKWRYLTAIADISKGKIESATTILKELGEDQNTPSKIKNLVLQQTARFYFEQSEFEEALKIYRTLKLDIREKGRSILERAWAHYYLKNYSKALGLLRALEAPYFAPSLTPERYILEMIIYKQLCHYEAVEETLSRFNLRFSSAIKSIRSRKPFYRDAIITSLALLDLDLQQYANFINLLREEKKGLEQFDFDDYKFYEPMLDEYSRKDQEIQARIRRTVERKSTSIAEDLLDSKSQVEYMDYKSKLDALRIVPKGEDRTYKSEQINFFQFTKMFWGVAKEYWSDELDDYKVLISSRCAEEDFSFDKDSHDSLEEDF